MASNPSHLLISRNPRSPATPQLVPTSTTTTALSAAPTPGPHLYTFPTNNNALHHPTPELPGRQRSHSTPSLTALTLRSEGERTRNKHDDGTESVCSALPTLVVHPTFRRDAAFPGRVKVIVGEYEFWCHKEILWFASPFFNALLQGGWAETRFPSTSSLCASRPSGSGEARDKASRPSTSLSQPSPPTDVDPPLAAPLDAFPLAPDAEDALCVETPPESQSSKRRSGYRFPSRKSERALGGIPGGRAIDILAAEGLMMDGEGTVNDGDETAEGQKASIYLDAIEDGPDVAEILRELREIPESTSITLPFDALANTGLPIMATTSPTPSIDSALANTRMQSAPPPLATTPPERPRSAPAPSSSSSVPAGRPPFTPPGPSVSCARIPSPSATPPAPFSISPPRFQPGLPLPCPPTLTTESVRRRGNSSNSREPLKPASLYEWPASRRAPSSEDSDRIDAIVELKEECPWAFQDFLFWAYPHLECKVTWENVEALLPLSSKLIIPSLQKKCEEFLMAHASGHPMWTLNLAEIHGNAELYREASRFVLDQPLWDEDEYAGLSDQTRIKLSLRRTWFLERLLKLGSIDVKKEFPCRNDCPDVAECQARLDEKWRQATNVVSRYGPPQPSVAFRCIRQLETFPTNPTLVMPHPLCQHAAKTWVITLFDRMFERKIPFSALNPGTEKYFLYIVSPRAHEPGPDLESL